MTCPSGQYYAADATWGACCSSGVTPCIYPTGCSANEVVYVNGGKGDW
jgi:hypothetical protein